MEIIFEKTYNGASIKGEAVMLSRYGDVLNVIDNKYHPNPGSKEEGYPEIERCIDWCYSNLEYCKPISKNLDNWIDARVSQELKENPSSSFEEVVLNVMYSDTYSPCEETLSSLNRAYETYSGVVSDIKVPEEGSEIKDSEKISNYINEKFTRVRAGGKLNPEGANAIYFRISSHGFDWHSVIVNFLWDMFDSPDKMPKKIWIGHDAENNPPEITLFEGTPKELLENEDDKLFENLFI